MSITIRDIMRLPSLHGARVVAGASGLGRVVSSVSVLETVNAGLIEGRAYERDDLGGGEVVITGFLNALDDEGLQLANVRQLAESGEAGLIIYYVGVYLRRIAPAIISYADGAGFPIICMPEGRPNLRYSDAISDIMGAVIHDRDSGASMTVSALDDIARLPERQRTPSTMVRLLSERLHASVVLLDAGFHPLYEAPWPHEYAGINQKVAGAPIPKPDGSPSRLPGADGLWEQRRQVPAQGATYELFTLALGSPIAPERLGQAAEAMRISLNIWGPRSSEAAISELVRAILDDEPLKMRTLATLFGIDIAAIHAMWVFHGEGLTNAQARQLAGYASIQAGTAFAGPYDGDIVLFMGALQSRDDAGDIRDLAREALPEGTAMTLFSYLETTTDVREAYLLQRASLADAMRILPRRRFFTRGDLGFAARCRALVDAGEGQVEEALSALDAFGGLRSADAMEETLSAFLLDADRGVARAATILGVHPNTVKYRLKAMSDRVGFSIGSMPESYDLYRATAIRRLIGPGRAAAASG